MSAKRIPLFECQECGKKFYTVAAAEKASLGDEGCPECGGSDIDEAATVRGSSAVAPVCS